MKKEVLVYRLFQIFKDEDEVKRMRFSKFPFAIEN